MLCGMSIHTVVPRGQYAYLNIAEEIQVHAYKNHAYKVQETFCYFIKIPTHLYYFFSIFNFMNFYINNLHLLSSKV